MTRMRPQWRYYFESTNLEGNMEVGSEYAETLKAAARQARRRLRGTGCKFNQIVERAQGMGPLFAEIRRAGE